jgi:mono/diheme cytochrome c family protein
MGRPSSSQKAEQGEYRMKRLISAFGIVGIAAVAGALGSFTPVFEKTYKIDASSALGKARCATCHVSAKGGKLNPYGKDIAAAMKAAKSTKLTAEILHKIDAMDSTKTGSKNIDKIKAGKNPGVE